MKQSFNILLQKLKKIIYIYDGASMEEKIIILQTINKLNLPIDQKLLEYHDLLLFLAAYPEHNKLIKLINLEFHRIGLAIKSSKQHSSDILLDTGLPYTTMITRFSHDLTVWMERCLECKISIDSFDKTGIDLNTLLKLTLPSLERDETTAGLNNDELLQTLMVTEKDRLHFLLSQMNSLDPKPLIKDYFWDALKLFVEIKGIKMTFSRSFNKANISEIFLQNQLLKKFDHLELIHRQLPLAKIWNDSEKSDLVSVIKKSLLLTLRETDPSTYMDENSLKFFELERGISIAIYGMQANRQLPLQSYIGYTLFKNAYPIAYGGSWVFGRSALFGLNIFESFRGGESGYIMCQLLRVYRQVFNVEYFEVEPYQYGLDNPDGIKSGAFWFYHRYGFRPIDSSLNALANREMIKIKANPQYHSSSKTLLRFTACNIGLLLASSKPMKYFDVTKSITQMIAKEFKGDRRHAIDYCIQVFLQKLSQAQIFNDDEKYVLEEVALISHSLKVDDSHKINLLLQMVRLKPVDPYLYNTVIIKLFNS